MSEYSELQERKNALRDEIRAFKMSIGELNQRKKDYPKDPETLADLDTAIAHHRYYISQNYEKLAEIQLKFERLNMDAAERRARKARRQE